MPFAQKHIGFEQPPRLFLRNDAKNAANPLGKTAFYDPNNMSITLYTTDRHPKDILRSLGHELVHHKQNCDGKFDDIGEMEEGYAQTNPHLRQMEVEANRDGSMCLRDFEDTLKQNNTIYFEHLQKGDNKMSTKDWKNGEIKSLLSESWGFKMDLSKLNESKGTLNEKHCAGKRDEEPCGKEDCPKCGKNRQDKSLEEKAKGKYDDGDGKDEKCDYVDCEGDEEVNEGGAALRQGNEDRLAQRHAQPDRIHEEDEEVVEEEFPGKRDMEQHKSDLSESRLKQIIAYALKTKA